MPLNLTNKITITGDSIDGLCFLLQYDIHIGGLTAAELKGFLDTVTTNIDDKQITELDLRVEDPVLRERLKEVAEHIKEGRKINAIKIFKEKDAVDMGLREAKDVIDHIFERTKNRPISDWKIYFLAFLHEYPIEHYKTRILEAFSKQELHNARGKILTNKLGL